MTFCCDPVGMLGVSLGTRVVADSGLLDRIVRWSTSFVGTSYAGDFVQDWQRCIFAVADRVLGSPLGLSIPNSTECADVRTALRLRGLIEADDSSRIMEDATQTLAVAVQQPPEEFTFERAALRLAAFQYVSGRRGKGTLKSLAITAAKRARSSGDHNRKRPVRPHAKYRID